MREACKITTYQEESQLYYLRSYTPGGLHCLAQTDSLDYPKEDNVSLLSAHKRFFKNCCSGTVVSIFLPPLSSTLSTPTFDPQSFPPLALSIGPLYMFLDLTLPLLSPNIPLPTGLCQFVLYFHVSVSIVLTCLFCRLGSTYR